MTKALVGDQTTSKPALLSPRLSPRDRVQQLVKMPRKSQDLPTPLGSWPRSRPNNHSNRRQRRLQPRPQLPPRHRRLLLIIPPPRILFWRLAFVLGRWHLSTIFALSSGAAAPVILPPKMGSTAKHAVGPTHCLLLPLVRSPGPTKPTGSKPCQRTSLPPSVGLIPCGRLVPPSFGAGGYGL